MDTSDFDYVLPAECIAQHPVEPRDRARLLVDTGAAPPRHRHMTDLPDELRPGDLVVVNDTRVLRARLALRKPTGGAAEVLLLEPWSGDTSTDATMGTSDRSWAALVRPSRRIATGTRLQPCTGAAEGVTVEVLDDIGGGRRRVRIIDAEGAPLDPGAELEVIDRIGAVPLPPYITAPLGDAERYQTVYARRPASAAAPTAGLHFTPALMQAVRSRDVGIEQVELVVGLDTFRPIVTDRVEDHAMHTESYVVPPQTWDAIRATRARGGSVVAVGTTTLRALESAAARDQLAGRTDLFIHRGAGGHTFRVVDRLLTNFHMPRSSLLVLIDAFVGPRWRTLYAEALEREYRFLSFGDAMLLTRDRTPGDGG